MSQGVVDPVKVTRSAVANAVSIAGLLLTTETLVVDKPAGGGAGRPPATGTPTDDCTTSERPGAPREGCTGPFVRPGAGAGQAERRSSRRSTTKISSRSDSDSPPHTP